jgi:hypothetical protein
MSVCSLRLLIRPLVGSTDREQREAGGCCVAVSFDGAGSIHETLFVVHERLCILVLLLMLHSASCSALSAHIKHPPRLLFLFVQKV